MKKLISLFLVVLMIFSNLILIPELAFCEDKKKEPRKKQQETRNVERTRLKAVSKPRLSSKKFGSAQDYAVIAGAIGIAAVSMVLSSGTKAENTADKVTITIPWPARKR